MPFSRLLSLLKAARERRMGVLSYLDLDSTLLVGPDFS
jgi:hypothetical protein